MKRAPRQPARRCVCQNCGAVFFVTKRDGAGMYCSRRCWGESRTLVDTSPLDEPASAERMADRHDCRMYRECLFGCEAEQVCGECGRFEPRDRDADMAEYGMRSNANWMG